MNEVVSEQNRKNAMRVYPPKPAHHQTTQGWVSILENRFGPRLAERLINYIGSDKAQVFATNYRGSMRLVCPRKLSTILNTYSQRVTEDWLFCHLDQIHSPLGNWDDDPLKCILVKGLEDSNLEALEAFYQEIEDKDFDTQASYLPTVEAFFIAPNMRHQQNHHTGYQTKINQPDLLFTGSAILGNPFGWGVVSTSEWTFEGSVLNETFHGTGSLQFSDGSMDIGQFYKGDFTGTGLRILADGTKIQGHFAQSKIQEGEITYPDGRVYKGSILNNQAHGQGTLIHGDVKVIGQFNSGAPAAPYEAHFSNGIRFIQYTDATETIFPNGMNIRRNASEAILQVNGRSLRFSLEEGLLGASSNTWLEFYTEIFFENLADIKLMFGHASFEYIAQDAPIWLNKAGDADKLFKLWTQVLRANEMTAEQLPSETICEQLLNQALASPIHWSLATSIIQLNPSLLKSLPESESLRSLLHKTLTGPDDLGSSVAAPCIPEAFMGLPAELLESGEITQEDLKRVQFILQRLAGSHNQAIFGMIQEISNQSRQTSIDLIKALIECYGYCETKAEFEVDTFYHNVLKRELSSSSERKLHDAFRSFLDHEVSLLAKSLVDRSERLPGNEIHVGSTIRNLIARRYPQLSGYGISDRLSDTLTQSELQLVELNLDRVIHPLTFLFFIEANLPDGIEKSPLIPQADLNALLEKISSESSLSDYYDFSDPARPRIMYDALINVLVNEGYVK